MRDSLNRVTQITIATAISTAIGCLPLAAYRLANNDRPLDVFLSETTTTGCISLSLACGFIGAVGAIAESSRKSGGEANA